MDDAVDAREIGWRQGLEEASLAAGPLLRQPFSYQGGYQAGKWLLNSASRPTAVFASSDMQGIGLLRAIHEAGLQVPKDIAIVSFDGSLEVEYCWPPLTTVAQPIGDMAWAAVDALLGGGGHKLASGAVLEVPLAEARARVLAAVEAALER